MKATCPWIPAKGIIHVPRLDSRIRIQGSQGPRVGNHFPWPLIRPREEGACWGSHSLVETRNGTLMSHRAQAVRVTP